MYEPTKGIDIIHGDAFTVIDGMTVSEEAKSLLKFFRKTFSLLHQLTAVFFCNINYRCAQCDCIFWLQRDKVSPVCKYNFVLSV